MHQLRSRHQGVPCKVIAKVRSRLSAKTICWQRQRRIPCNLFQHFELDFQCQLRLLRLRKSEHPLPVDQVSVRRRPLTKQLGSLRLDHRELVSNDRHDGLRIKAYVLDCSHEPLCRAAQVHLGALSGRRLCPAVGSYSASFIGQPFLHYRWCRFARGLSPPATALASSVVQRQLFSRQDNAPSSRRPTV